MRWTNDQLFVASLLAVSLFPAGLSSSAMTLYGAVVAAKALGFSSGTYPAIITFSALTTVAASLVWVTCRIEWATVVSW